MNNYVYITINSVELKVLGAVLWNTSNDIEERIVSEWGWEPWQSLSAVP